MDPLRHQERAATEVDQTGKNMNVQCSELDDLLFDASPLAMETAARHAERCPECAEKLAAWNEIEQTAQSMRGTWQNDLLWPRIERALANERMQKRPRAKWLWQVAAGFLLTIGLGGTVLYTV